MKFTSYILSRHYIKNSVARFGVYAIYMHIRIAFTSLEQKQRVKDIDIYSFERIQKIYNAETSHNLYGSLIFTLKLSINHKSVLQAVSIMSSIIGSDKLPQKTQ